jgi:hypothetical protein
MWHINGVEKCFQNKRRRSITRPQTRLSLLVLPFGELEGIKAIIWFAPYHSTRTRASWSNVKFPATMTACPA